MNLLLGIVCFCVAIVYGWVSVSSAMEPIKLIKDPDISIALWAFQDILESSQKKSKFHAVFCGLFVWLGLWLSWLRHSGDISLCIIVGILCVFVFLIASVFLCFHISNQCEEVVIDMIENARRNFWKSTYTRNNRYTRNQQRNTNNTTTSKEKNAFAGIFNGLSPIEAKKLYRQKVKELHPDNHMENKEKYTELYRNLIEEYQRACS